MIGSRKKDYRSLVAYIENNQDNFYRFVYAQLPQPQLALTVIQTVIAAALDELPSAGEQGYQQYFRNLLLQRCRCVQQSEIQEENVL